jgi:UDP-N-acetylglucosamine acyltransferase
MAAARRLAATAGAAVVHPTAIVELGAVLEPGVRIGPHCIVGPDVVLREGAHLIASVHVAGRTVLGARSTVYPFACLGFAPQDKKHAGEETRLEIGAECVIREHVTAHTGTVAGGGVTRIGDGVLLMAGAHVAHDCDVGRGAVLANAALLAGHVRLGTQAIVGGHCAVHQFVTIGRGAFIGGGSVLTGDVGPFSLAHGNRAALRGINLVGLRRAATSRDDVKALLRAFRRLFGGYGTYFAPRESGAAHGSRGTLAEAADELRASPSALVRELASFVLDPRRTRHMCPVLGSSSESGAD